MINITHRNSLFLFRLNGNLIKSLLKRNIPTSSRTNLSNMTIQSENINSEKINFANEINNEPTKLVKVSLIGLPNAGKSSIINKIAGRMVTHDIFITIFHITYLFINKLKGLINKNNFLI